MRRIRPAGALMTAKKLRAWLKAHRLTQPELAQLLDVHPRTVSRWLREDSLPAMAVLAIAWLTHVKGRT